MHVVPELLAIWIRFVVVVSRRASQTPQILLKNLVKV